MKRMLFCILLVVILGACDQQDSEYVMSDEGVIVNIEKSSFEGFEGHYLILTIPSVDNINISDKTEDELIKLAQENEGAYYRVSQEKYEELSLDIGEKIIAYYNGQGESNPPVRDTDKIEVISAQ